MMWGHKWRLSIQRTASNLHYSLNSCHGKEFGRFSSRNLGGSVECDAGDALQTRLFEVGSVRLLTRRR